MNVLRWMSTALTVLMAAGLVVWLLRTRGTRRSLGQGLLFVGITVQGLSGFFRDTVTGIALLAVSFVLMVWSGALLVRETRAIWREQMERVKHL